MKLPNPTLVDDVGRWLHSACGTPQLDHDQLQIVLKRIEETIPEPDSAPECVVGWVFTVFSVRAAITCVLGNEVVWNAEYCAENAYAAYEQEALAELRSSGVKAPGVVLDEELLALCPEISQEADYMLECLDRCERGLPIPRQWTPTDEPGGALH